MQASLRASRSPAFRKTPFAIPRERETRVYRGSEAGPRGEQRDERSGVRARARALEFGWIMRSAADFADPVRFSSRGERLSAGNRPAPRHEWRALIFDRATIDPIVVHLVWPGRFRNATRKFHRMRGTHKVDLVCANGVRVRICCLVSYESYYLALDIHTLLTMHGEKYCSKICVILERIWVENYDWDYYVFV